MLLRATVEDSVLTERGCLEVNPIINFETLSKLKGIISAKVEEDEWAYLYLPFALYGSSVDLAEYLSIRHVEALTLLPYSKELNASKITKLRIYYLVEVTDSIQAVDLEYEDSDESYKLKKVTVYDERGSENNYKYTYNIKSNLDDSSYIQSLKLNLETKELTQNVVFRTNAIEG